MWFWNIKFKDGTSMALHTKEQLYGPKDIGDFCVEIQHKSVWWYIGRKLKLI